MGREERGSRPQPPAEDPFGPFAFPDLDAGPEGGRGREAGDDGEAGDERFDGFEGHEGTEGEDEDAGDPGEGRSDGAAGGHPRSDAPRRPRPSAAPPFEDEF